MPIWPYIHVLHFFLTQGSLGVVSPPRFFLWYVSPSQFGLLGIFLLIIFHPRWGSLKRLGICWVWNSWFWICCVYFSLTWAVVLHFLEAKNFVFVMFLWLGSSPTFSVAFSQCLPSWKSFLCCPTSLRRDHILLSVVDEFIFGHVRAKTSMGYYLILVGCSYPPMN